MASRVPPCGACPRSPLQGVRDPSEDGRRSPCGACHRTCGRSIWVFLRNRGGDGRRNSCRGSRPRGIHLRGVLRIRGPRTCVPCIRPRGVLRSRGGVCPRSPCRGNRLRGGPRSPCGACLRNPCGRSTWASPRRRIPCRNPCGRSPCRRIPCGACRRSRGGLRRNLCRGSRLRGVRNPCRTSSRIRGGEAGAPPSR